MWPELCVRRFVTSPVTQTWPTCFSSSRRTCSVSSLTDNTFRVCSVGNSSPKSHWDLDWRFAGIYNDQPRRYSLRRYLLASSELVKRRFGPSHSSFLRRSEEHTSELQPRFG